MEELKLRYMQLLLNRKLDVPVDHYISIMKEMTKRARGCYAELPISLDSDNDQFTEMLVLDGCFIIEVIISLELYRSTFPDRSSYRILQRDLILLENQIPFFVLCELFDIIEGPDKRSLFMDRVMTFCNDVFPGKTLHQVTRKPEEVKHILDLVHSNWCPPTSSDHQTITIPIHMSTISPPVIPSASELKDVNVKFGNKEYNCAPGSNTPKEDRCTTLFEVEFRVGCGKLMMPTLVIDDGTESMLRNLIAYEQLFPKDEPKYCVDYAQLLDRLINKPKDVRTLCDTKIIQNMLGSDKAVVHFVNKLTETIIVDESFVYGGMFAKINAHHKRRWNRAVAVFHRDYFGSPWAYIAFLGAFLLLQLTIAQTIFSAFQVYKP